MLGSQKHQELIEGIRIHAREPRVPLIWSNDKAAPGTLEVVIPPNHGKSRNDRLPTYLTVSHTSIDKVGHEEYETREYKPRTHPLHDDYRLYPSPTDIRHAIPEGGGWYCTRSTKFPSRSVNEFFGSASSHWSSASRVSIISARWCWKWRSNV